MATFRTVNLIADADSRLFPTVNVVTEQDEDNPFEEVLQTNDPEDGTFATWQVSGDSVTGLKTVYVASYTLPSAGNIALDDTDDTSLNFIASRYGSVSITSCAVLTSISFPTLDRATSFFLNDNTSLTTVSLPSGLLRVDGNFIAANCALSQASVNAILVRLAALDGTAGTTSYDNKTIDMTLGTSAAPSAPGLAAKTTLEGRGCTVNVN
jgi:hypothetical protein